MNERQGFSRWPRWRQMLSIAAIGLLLTYVIGSILADNPLIYSYAARIEFLAVGALISALAGVLIPQELARRPAHGKKQSAPFASRRHHHPVPFFHTFVTNIPFATLLVAMLMVLGPFNRGAPGNELEWLGIGVLIAIASVALTLFGFTQWLRQRFGGLSWRLFLSYFLVTLIAATVVLYLSSADQDRAIPLPALISIVVSWLRPSRNGAIYFALLAALIGTITGVLISRNLTRRLRQITRVTDAWSQGEFSAAIHDPTDLHDTVKQHVFANTLLVRAARKLMDDDPQKARTYLADAEALGGQTQQELIALIQALRPAALEDRGLVAVLGEYVLEWSSRADIAAELRAQGERATPLDVEEALFRVAQEALANAARHSGARQVEVSLCWESERVRLTVTDEGKGFDATRAEGRGLGLASMRERMMALAGTLEVTSTALGTTVAAEAPLLSAAPAEQMEAARG